MRLKSANEEILNKLNILSFDRSPVDTYIFRSAYFVYFYPNHNSGILYTDLSYSAVDICCLILNTAIDSEKTAVEIFSYYSRLSSGPSERCVAVRSPVSVLSVTTRDMSRDMTSTVFHFIK
jgi:hypothetical protein